MFLSNHQNDYFLIVLIVHLNCLFTLYILLFCFYFYFKLQTFVHYNLILFTSNLFAAMLKVVMLYAIVYKPCGKIIKYPLTMIPFAKFAKIWSPRLAIDQLRSNETMEELKEVFEGSCNLIPIKIVKKECCTLADNFIPELVEALSSQMNPDVSWNKI